MKRFFPLLAVPSVTSDRTTVFHTKKEKVVLEMSGGIVKQLIALCDGVRTIEEIAKHFEDEGGGTAVKELIHALSRKNVIVDARHIGEAGWSLIENPSQFPNDVTPRTVVRLVRKAQKRHQSNPTACVYEVRMDSFERLLEKRRSIRSFSGVPLDLECVSNLVWSSYGTTRSEIGGNIRKTTPSAGALYPLLIHVALFKKSGDLDPGVYAAYLGQPHTVGFRLISRDIHRFSRAFLDPLMFNHAHGSIVISGSLRITAEKYGNRSMLYVPLEAGHAAQNVHLAAVCHNVASVEIGGFMDSLLAEAIQLPKHYHPLITIAFGTPLFENEDATPDHQCEINWDIPANDCYRPQFAIASARVSRGRDWSHGRDESPAVAHMKAVAEAREWAACGGIPKLVKARFTELENAIRPETVIAFHPAQYRVKGFPFKPFDENADYEWTESFEEETGSRAHMLADLVYFPYFPKTPYYAYANSSGVAAHPNRQQALESSTLELVERDAFMIAYFTRLAFPTVREETIPDSIRKRVQDLRRAGFRTWIKDHSLDLAPVATVILQSTELAYTVCSSSSNFDLECAVGHALMEAEASALGRIQNGPPKPITPENVGMPLDHGNLYDGPRYFRQADFLTRSQRNIQFKEMGGAVRSWPELLRRFKAKGWKRFTIPLQLAPKHGGNSDLTIVRSIVPGVIPMTFGYRQEPAGMKRLYDVAEAFGNRRISYRDLTKFPHPFA